MLTFLRPWTATCRETGDRLSDYVDGELQGRSLVRVRRHLARCHRCRALLASLEQTIEQLRALGGVERPARVPATVSAVLTRIERLAP